MSVDEDDEDEDAGLAHSVSVAEEQQIDLRARLEKYGLLDHDIRKTLSFTIPYAFAPAGNNWICGTVFSTVFLPWLIYVLDVLPDLVKLRMHERQKRIWRHSISKASTPHLASVLKKKLKKRQAQISRLEDEKVKYMSQVERCGHESVRMSQEMSGTRLHMFTRRVRRR
jgi:hypothetical protein